MSKWSYSCWVAVDLHHETFVSEIRVIRQKHNVISSIYIIPAYTQRSETNTYQRIHNAQKQQVTQLWQRDCVMHNVILRGWVTLRLNFRSKDNVSCQYLWTVRPGKGYTTTLLLKVFIWGNFLADFIPQKLNLIQKTKTLFWSHPLGTKGVTYTLHIYIL